MENAYQIQTGVKNEILRTPSKPVPKITKKIKEFSKVLLEKMYEYDGVGLAAPQIWVNQRMIAITFWKEDPKDPNNISLIEDVVMINPEIVSKSKEMFLFEEACLSVPWVTGNVLRHRNIKIQYQTVEWKTITKKLSNMNAVIIQHEIDHLDAILFVDKMVD